MLVIRNIALATCLVLVVPAVVESSDWLVVENSKMTGDDAEKLCNVKGGYRLPTRFELSANLRRVRVPVESLFPTPVSSMVVTSSSKGLESIWVVHSGTGDVGWAGKDAMGAVVCVRQAFLIDRPEVTFKIPSGKGKVSWERATATCKGVMPKAAWRLPSVPELESLLNENGDLVTSYTLEPESYWSGDNIENVAWAVEFKHGSSMRHTKNTPLQTICVSETKGAMGNLIKKSPRINAGSNAKVKRKWQPIIKMTMHMTGDAVTGYTIKEVSFGKFPDQGKVAVGDLVTKVNGQAVYDPDSVLRFWENAGNTMTVVRDGKEIELQSDPPPNP